jgi:DNA (cytosine-5)-methyltransferase 1
MEKLKVGSLFAGVGGVCEAFKQSSCDVVWANEIDKKACMTYRLNHETTNCADNKRTYLIEGDIKTLPNLTLSNIDILTAGFPCQPFSQAGHGLGFDDERGKLFFDLMDVLKERKPKAYFFENVKSLATHNKRKSFELIKKEIKKAGYSFIPFVLNASEYTDIPQGRQRIYIVGFKGESEFSYDAPIKFNSIKDKRFKFSTAFNIPEKMKVSPKKVETFLDSSTVIESDIYNQTDNKIHTRIIEAVKDHSVVYQYRRYYIRDNKSNVCPTLTANMGGGGHNIPIILMKNEKYPRRLTPKECFNLQGFPVNFKLPNKIARGQLYKQAGNSVVVPMVRKIATEIVRVLNAEN